MRQGSVLYMGALAKHIAPDDPKIVQVVHKLLDTLGTPSEQVQRTISVSLAGLVGKAAVKPQAAEHVDRLLETLLGTESYAQPNPSPNPNPNPNPNPDPNPKPNPNPNPNPSPNLGRDGAAEQPGRARAARAHRRAAPRAPR